MRGPSDQPPRDSVSRNPRSGSTTAQRNSKPCVNLFFFSTTLIYQSHTGWFDYYLCGLVPVLFMTLLSMGSWYDTCTTAQGSRNGRVCGSTSVSHAASLRRPAKSASGGSPSGRGKNIDVPCRRIQAPYGGRKKAGVPARSLPSPVPSAQHWPRKMENIIAQLRQMLWGLCYGVIVDATLVLLSSPV